MAEIKGIEVSGEVYNISDETARNATETNATSIGTLTDLETEEKSNLVEAINEIAGASGGTPAILVSESPTTTQQQLVLSGFTHDVELFVNLSISGVSKNLLMKLFIKVSNNAITAVTALIISNGEIDPFSQRAILSGMFFTDDKLVIGNFAINSSFAVSSKVAYIGDVVGLSLLTVASGTYSGTSITREFVPIITGGIALTSGYLPTGTSSGVNYSTVANNNYVTDIVFLRTADSETHEFHFVWGVRTLKAIRDVTAGKTYTIGETISLANGHSISTSSNGYGADTASTVAVKYYQAYGV